MTSPITSGQRLTPARLNALGQRLFAYKAGDTARASTTAFAADPHLSLAVEADTIYTIEIVGILTGSATAAADYKWRIAFPSGSTVHAGHIGMANNQAVDSGIAQADFGAEQNQTSSPTDAVLFLGAIASAPTLHVIRGLLIVGGTPGSLTLEWAQATSSGTATTLKAGSQMLLRRVG